MWIKVSMNGRPTVYFEGISFLNKSFKTVWVDAKANKSSKHWKQKFEKSFKINFEFKRMFKILGRILKLFQICQNYFYSRQNLMELFN